MKEMVRCKACGYLMEKDALGDVCPACGVKKEMFEPWEDKVGALRRTWMELDIHPVTVHFPEAFAVVLLLSALVFPLVPAGFQTSSLWPAVQFLSWLFPVAVLAGFVTGLADGKVRYRKVTTPRLLQKIIVGSVLILSSLVQAFLVSVASFGSLSIWLGFLVASAVSAASTAILGLWGARLMVGAMPGDKIFLGKKKKKPAAKAAPVKVPEEKKE